MEGTIKTLRIEKGFGFIKDNGGKEYFFHLTAVEGEDSRRASGRRHRGTSVADSPKGRRADSVGRTST
jgi:cold shock CspA family protein